MDKIMDLKKLICDNLPVITVRPN